MDLSEKGDEKKLPRVRRLSTLGAIRKELIRVYEECREAGPNPEKVQFYRALCFILGAAAQVRKDEALEDVERRLDEIEKASEARNERA